MQITVEVIDQPSRSKGWARYAVSLNGAAIITSTTGNRWVSSTTKQAEVEPGAIIEVESQIQLAVGKGHYARKETTSRTYRLQVAEGQTAEMSHKPGSQGQTLRVTGARLLE